MGGIAIAEEFPTSGPPRSASRRPSCAAHRLKRMSGVVGTPRSSSCAGSGRPARPPRPGAPRPSESAAPCSGSASGSAAAETDSSLAAPVQPISRPAPAQRPHRRSWDRRRSTPRSGARRRHAEREARDVHRLLVGEPAVLADFEVLAGLDRVRAYPHLDATAPGRLPEVGGGADVRGHGRREHQEGERPHRGRLGERPTGGQAECAPGAENPRAGGQQPGSTRRVVNRKPILTDRSSGDTALHADLTSP